MKKLFVCALALAAFVACDKEPNVGGGDEVGKVYMSFSVKMETTRTGTDNTGNTNSDASPDYEVGKDRENTISSVDIILAKADQYFKAEKVEIKNVSVNGDINQTYIASFNSLNLVEGADYKVYIYANCTAPAKEDGENATSNAAIGAMTAENKFWMTNAYAANTVKIPADLSAHNSPNSPFNMGEHYVERSMARFDFMPKNNNKFELADGVTVTLTEAAIINQSKDFYMLRRVSNDGTANGAVVGGVETPQNYVVDVDYAAKANGYDADDVKNFDAHMTLPLTWTWKSIASADLTKADADLKDNWDGSNDGTDDPMTGDPDEESNPTEEGTPEHVLNDYYIWQYAKENTIPGTTIQEHGISTGIVFKGKIEGAAVTAANGDPIYVFENKLYGTWDKVVAAAEADNAPATLVAAVNAVGETRTVKALADAGFTGYSADEKGNYYAYYYYWNRHNDNGDNTKMGIMEFAVVRNNVYKLCVDKISKLGHPEPPTDPNDPKNPDPDPVDPKDPDEELNYYFNVTVKVLPWVVRVNHIEF